jgi:hypothetical protein
MVETRKRPRVFVSYTWRPKENMARAFQLAEDLRARGMDARIDVYFKDRHHGFSPPEPSLDDRRDPWILWAESEIKAADCVLLLSTEQYAASDPDRGAIGGEWFRWHELPYEEKLATNGPYVWWDWHAMYKDWKSDKALAPKFVPVGFGHYTSCKEFIPGFLRNATYYNLESQSDVEGVIRGVRAAHRKRNPRNGIFISYAHDDEPEWIATLLTYLAPVERKGVRIWTDKEIRPGELWHVEIQDALATAKVAVLLVSQNFIASQYIASHELPQLLDAAKTDGLTIFWIPIKPSTYKDSEIQKYQAAHSPNQPISSLRGAKRDQAFVAITSKLADALADPVARQ